MTQAQRENFTYHSSKLTQVTGIRNRDFRANFPISPRLLQAPSQIVLKPVAIAHQVSRDHPQLPQMSLPEGIVNVTAFFNSIQHKQGA